MGKLNNNEAFKHINYHETNLQRTFARVRKELAEKKAKAKVEAAAISVEAAVKVHVLKGTVK